MCLTLIKVSAFWIIFTTKVAFWLVFYTKLIVITRQTHRWGPWRGWTNKNVYGKSNHWSQRPRFSSCQRFMHSVVVASFGYISQLQLQISIESVHVWAQSRSRMDLLRPKQNHCLDSQRNVRPHVSTTQHNKCREADHKSDRPSRVAATGSYVQQTDCHLCHTKTKRRVWAKWVWYGICTGFQPKKRS